MFLSLTDELTPQEVRRVLVQSVLTASLVSILFLFLGQGVFQLLGVTLADFTVAGGILLFVIAMSDLLSFEKRQRKPDIEHLGAVPIGVPLIAGPAVLTTVVLLAGEHGHIAATLAAVVNIILAGFIFFWSQNIDKLLGRSGIKTISKIASLILASFAVMMIRKGVTSFF
jgi:multiple antibiotic resistance protein